MAPWRTSAAAAAVVLLATACGYTSPARETVATKTVPSKAQLAPAGQKPLKVKGTGFLPDEHVKVATKGKTVTTVADSQGTFVVSLPGVNGCDSVNVVATGADGSHAEFNLSQITCNGT
ncbi:MAG TPA: hypothetical protein VLK24_11695 [Gaiellaceae bacterium]|nr:hypothetical protein [Gaiellaceae bacterium]